MAVTYRDIYFDFIRGLAYSGGYEIDLPTSYKFLFIDFEYTLFHNSRCKPTTATAIIYDIKNKKTIKDISFNFFKKSEIKKAKEFFLKHKDLVHVGYSIGAEIRGMHGLGIPLKYSSSRKWIDLQVEHKRIVNWLEKYAYGKQVIGGSEKYTFNPKYKRGDKDKRSFDKPDKHLVSFTYLFTGREVIRDSAEKDLVRDMHIKNNISWIKKNIKRVSEYCHEDVKYLPRLYLSCTKAYCKNAGIKFKAALSHQLYAGSYSALNGHREIRGYYINKPDTEYFSSNIRRVLNAICREINFKLFPDKHLFQWHRKDKRFVFKQKPVQDFIAQSPLKSRWPRSKKTKGFKLDKDTIAKFYSFKHTYPESNFMAQVIRYKHLDSSLKGFAKSSTSKSKCLKDYIYNDINKVTPYINSYGSQAGRNQPLANGFIFLKPAWTRQLVQPPLNKLYLGLDYASEEFLINGLLSGDSNMIADYKTGDIYLAFGHGSKMIPLDGTKKTHGTLRDVCKKIILGIGYGMGAESLALSIQNEGIKCSVARAESYIKKFYSRYRVFYSYKKFILREYKRSKKLWLPDGWILFGDNPNKRSVFNFNPQGMGSVIMRKAELALKRDHGIIADIPLHDGFYYCIDNKNVLKTIDLIHYYLKKGFEDTFHWTKDASSMRLDAKLWGPSIKKPCTKKIYLKKSSCKIEIDVKKLHIDERSRKESKQFKVYMRKEFSLELQ